MIEQKRKTGGAAFSLDNICIIASISSSKDHPWCSDTISGVRHHWFHHQCNPPKYNQKGRSGSMKKQWIETVCWTKQLAKAPDNWGKQGILQWRRIKRNGKSGTNRWHQGEDIKGEHNSE